MKKMIPLSKQTKRLQKAHHNQKRRSWGNVCPVTRIVESKKVYDRKELKKLLRNEQAYLYPSTGE